MTPDDIKGARRKLGLSARQLAPLLGYDRLPSVYDIEAGRERPSRAVVLLLRAYLAGYRPPEWPDPPHRPPSGEGANASNPLNAQDLGASGDPPICPPLDPENEASNAMQVVENIELDDPEMPTRGNQSTGERA